MNESSSDGIQNELIDCFHLYLCILKHDVSIILSIEKRASSALFLLKLH